MNALNPQMSAANARAKAIQQLINNHLDEWDELYANAREAEGLPRQVGASSAHRTNLELRRRVAELEEQLRNGVHTRP